jgi:hypothetical protein
MKQVENEPLDETRTDVIDAEVNANSWHKSPEIRLELQPPKRGGLPFNE